ncbi:MAG: hypothetical protein HY735_19895 [Verrucomicrobia bacterium]|nr:hypothetical protein [Verrucomicrobiota bacterium]
MGTARQRHVAAKLENGQVFIFAGFAKSDVELFHVAAEAFEGLSCKHWFGDLNGISLSNGRVLLVDGRNESVFDPVARQFTRIERTFTGKGVRWPVMLTLPNGTVFLCGGFDDRFRPIRDCAIFDPRTQRFEAVGKLAQPRARHTANLINENEVLIAGGASADSETSFNTAEIFNLKTGSSKLLPGTMNQPRCMHCSANLSNGEILLAGGYCAQQLDSALSSAEVFDSTTRIFLPVGPMAVSRYEPQAAGLPSGRVAIIGGYDDVRIIEVYCPQERQFTVADQLIVEPRRSGFTVTPLDTGELLLTGGRVNSTDEELDNAEIFSEMKIKRTGAKEAVKSPLSSQDTALGSRTETVLKTAANERGRARGHAHPRALGRKTCQRRRRSRSFGNAVKMVIQVANVIFGPVRSRFSHFQHRRDKWIILRPRFRGDHFNLGALRQLRLGRQDDDTVLDYSFVAHACLITRFLGRRKHRRGTVSPPRVESSACRPSGRALGDTIAVITVPESVLEPLREDEVCCVRTLE